VIALLLALALAQGGTLVLCGESFELPEPLARELAGGAPHLVLEFGAAGLDPLARGRLAGREARPLRRVGLQREAALLPELGRTRAVVVSGADVARPAGSTSSPSRRTRVSSRSCARPLRGGRPVIATGPRPPTAPPGRWSRARRSSASSATRAAKDPNLVANGLAFAEAG